MSAPPETPARRGGAFVRNAFLVIAVALGAASAWLIVTGDAKQTKIGVLLGLWGLLLAAYQVVGGRHPHETAAAVAPSESAGSSLQTRESADAMRAYEQRLEAMLRQLELMSAELAGVRAELATMRIELVDKVGGQLRLERTETTQQVGSDVAAADAADGTTASPGGRRHRDSDAAGHDELARILAREGAAHR